MKQGCLIAAVVAVVLLVVLVVTSVKTYNGLVRRSETVDMQWSEIDNMLQRRADLIPNLVETVKGYAKHESAIFTAVADARSRLLAAKTVDAKGAATGELNSALGRLLAIAENYPQLKADTTFLRLQDELAGTENRIAVARTRYNEAAQQYNASLRTFPSVLFAGAMGLQKKPYFEVQDPAAKVVPKVEF